MTTPVQDFGDVLRLLDGMELFRHSAEALAERYGDTYRSDAVFLLRKTDEFARLCGDDLRGSLASYRSWIERTAAERTAGEALPEPGSDRDYLYALTLSTALNRSRYELLQDCREAVRHHLNEGDRTLEVGAGNCLMSALAADRGPVQAYERNELSRLWLPLLAPAGRVDLRIEDYRFDEPHRFQLVLMVELLEHVADPAALLDGAHRVLVDGGLAYFTFAVRMPQFDHLTDFQSIEECRELLADGGFAVCRERCLVDTYLPFEDEDRWRLGADPRYAVVYCCLARKQALSGDLDLQAFNEEITR